MAHELSAKKISYLHVVEGGLGTGQCGTRRYSGDADSAKTIQGNLHRQRGVRQQDCAALAIEQGIADLVSFGIPFLANPDLPKRFEKGAPLNRPDLAALYTGDDKGSVDYPKLNDEGQEVKYCVVACPSDCG
jgi:N-ethylmaleimide reductase